MSGIHPGHYLRRLWRFFSLPSRRWPLGLILAAGVAIGALSLGGYNEAVVQTNKTSFCLSCHEMKGYVYDDYVHSVHYKNPVGVRATCKDCHEPGDWWHQLGAKVLSVNDLYNHVAGTISTREKFDEHRPELDKAVWAQFKADDSRTCRKCHSWNAMLTSVQPPAARASHLMAQHNGLTCIDCHRGIMRMKANFTLPGARGAAGP